MVASELIQKKQKAENFDYTPLFEVKRNNTTPPSQYSFVGEPTFFISKSIALLYHESDQELTS